MATAEQVNSLRRATAIAADDELYTDSLLGGMIDDLGFETAAATVWREKAALVAGLVDTTESGSSRRLSQLREGYLAMAKAAAPDDTGSKGITFTVGAERV